MTRVDVVIVFIADLFVSVMMVVSVVIIIITTATIICVFVVAIVITRAGFVVEGGCDGGVLAFIFETPLRLDNVE